MRRPTDSAATPLITLVVAGARHPYGRVALMALMVMISALAVVYTKHETRKLFVEMEALEQTRDELAVEWSQLQLEQATLATQGRVERTASTQLGMVLPGPEAMVIVRP